MTPEELLEETLRVRWPTEIPESAYRDAVNVVIGFSQLLRSTLPERKSRQKREPEEGATPEESVRVTHPDRPAPRMDKEVLAERLKTTLLSGSWGLRGLMKETGAQNYQQVWDVTKRVLNARKTVDGSGHPAWTLQPNDSRTNDAKAARKTAATPKRRRRVRRVQAWGPEYIERLRLFMSRGPTTMAAAGRHLGIGAESAARLARGLGAIRGTNPQTYSWELPPTQ